MPSSITVDLAGYTDLPAGKVATIVTYLEMRARPLARRAVNRLFPPQRA